MEWYVKLKGTNDLERLSKFAKLSNCLITKSGEEYILKSQFFTKLKDARDINIKAEEIISYINSISAFLFNFESPIKSYTIACVDDKGRETQFILPESIECKTKVGTPTILVNGVVQGTNIEDKFVDLLDLAFKDEDFRDLFGIIKDDNNWYELRGIYEIIERSVKSPGTLLKLSELTNNTQLTDLKKTIDMHHHRRKQPKHKHPEKPYTIKEARKIIRNMVNNWIDMKLKTIR